jgi:plastocyanin
MNRFLSLAPAALACLALAFAGCGSSSKSSTSSSSSTPPASTPPASTPSTASSGGASAGKTVEVTMQNTAFAPKSISAKVGQTIVWTNKDPFDHNVTAKKGEEFKSKNFGQGAKYSYKLDKAGTISYVCTIHPGMDGTITVTK